MKAGRQLDALIAEKVMGMRLPTGVSWVGNFPPLGETQVCPFYSTDIAAAWEVVEKLGCTFSVGTQGFGWHAHFLSPEFGHVVSPPGDTAPHAICLAALKAVGVTL